VTGTTVALLGLGAAGAGYWFLVRPRLQAAAAGASGAAASSPSSSGGLLSKVGGAFDTWDKVSGAGIATAVAAKVPIPATAKPAVAAIGTSYVKYLTPVGQVGLAVNAVQHPVDTAKAIINAPVDLTKKIGTALGLGSSKVCRASNGKDVFPNDMQLCAQYGRTDCNSCGLLYDLNTRKWPWQ
jgi:hypothetical protein